jgi:hypothetical protein
MQKSRCDYRELPPTANNKEYDDSTNAFPIAGIYDMYEELPLELLKDNRSAPNRMPRMFYKKLRYNIQRIGRYETLTVRRHPERNGCFEVLNGHARLQVLRVLGASSVKCDIWEVSDLEAHLFLAVLNRLCGSEVPELRMGLLFDLLKEIPKNELAAHIPETLSHLDKLAQLEAISKEPEITSFEKSFEKPGAIVMNFHLKREQYEVVLRTINDITIRCNAQDSETPLVTLAQYYLDHTNAED